MAGKAYLIGAGPGRADLITVRGLHFLRQAEVLLYDRLIARELLDEVPDMAERIFVGKGVDRHMMSQDDIAAVLVNRVQAGKQVVRLKGGDPFIFGRGGEEIKALAEAGLLYEIIPGVSSITAVPAYAGIPITYRGFGTSFAVVTGHEAPGKPESETDWAVLSKIPTLLILMAVKHIESICAAIRQAGRDPDTPAIAISWGTTDKQQSVLATLTTLPVAIAQQKLPTPVVVVIGPVVSLTETLAWFTSNGEAAGFVPFPEG